MIRCLGKDRGLAGLEQDDYDFVMKLYHKNGVLGAVSLIKEGDRVHINDPLFEGRQGLVAQIDHRKQRAKIVFQFDRKEWAIWVACDVVYGDEGRNGDR